MILPGLFLDWAVLAVSFFNAISLSWLGFMVMLIGNRRAAGNWLTGVGLLLGALFFTSHTAIFGRGLAETGFGMNFWWWVSWTPAAVAPLAWYAAMLWHTGFRMDRPHPHRAWLAFSGMLALSVLLLLIFANPLPYYQYVAVRAIRETPSIGGVPIIILAYLGYSILCYLLPLDLLRLPAPVDDPHLVISRRQARPWLVGASLAMLLATLLLAWTATWALSYTPLPSLSRPAVATTVKLFDLSVSALVAIAITLLGRAIVAYEVFTGRPLPRDRFTSQWRGTVILAAGFGLVAAGMLVMNVRPIYSLMIATALSVIFYVLISWRSFADREILMARLRPFLAGQDLLERLASPQASGDPAARPLFETLCRDLLTARAALLVPAGRLAALAGPALSYPPGAQFVYPPANQWKDLFAQPVRCVPLEGRLAWAVPLWSQEELAGVLFLGEKLAGGLYSEEEIDLAQAGGERLLDRLAGAEVARLSLELLRRRLAEARVLEGQGRRVLHDEVLPELHTALLYLSETAPNHAAVEILASAHRRISDMLHSGYGAPERLAQVGLIGALRALLENDFNADFEKVDWQIESGAGDCARNLQPFVLEVVYFAARELVRNAAKYARGAEPGRKLHLTIRFDVYDDHLRVSIVDDGIGPQNGSHNKGENGPHSGGGSGLRIHSALLAAVGGSLEISPGFEGGTSGLIVI